ncbi:unnamed protein product [Polarella glacialis]|uniref:Protein kinase domain-containing protein n=1 Tax=Polarella glacialis TaxID=89957 RepID=A0A813L0J5_POLGL|nr:unnamed protein product [Polarella glacialis]CAE8717893.1 unnamed protein product [Polarella glacialis]
MTVEQRGLQDVTILMIPRCSGEGLKRQSSEGTPEAGQRGGGLLQRRRVGLTLKCLRPVERVGLQLSEVSKLSDGYTILERLGQGSTGVVYRAARKADGKEVAVKCMRTTDEEMIDMLRKEFEVIRSVRHPNIIQTFDFFTTRESAVLVLEVFEGPSLHRAVKRSPAPFTEATAKVLFQMLMNALAYLHGRHIVHRDVKAANILVSEDLQDLRLIDFNTAHCLADGEALTMTGTQTYSAPEILLGESPSECGDIWCAGLCLHLMLSRKVPWRHENYPSLAAYTRAVATEPVSFQGSCWSTVSEQCKSTIGKCLTVDKCLRPTASALLTQDNWLQHGEQEESAVQEPSFPGSEKSISQIPPISAAVDDLSCRVLVAWGRGNL